LFWYGINFLSFSIVEVESIDKFWPLKYVFELSVLLFGKTDVALRVPSLFFSALSVILFYNISRFYFKKQNDMLFATVIFSLIPGFIISSLIVNKSIYLIFLTLLFIYLYKTGEKISYVLLFFLAFVDYSFIVLYLGLIFYSINKKYNKLLIFSLFLLAINANYFNYTIDGKPKGYFLDVIGTYILIFSPLVFVYFLYSIYKGFFYKKDIIFYVAVTAFLSSVLFSFRQRIKIDDYAPFVLPYLIYMVKIYINSYRIRLPKLRRGYKLLFFVLFSSLIIFDIALFLNKYTPARELSESFYFIKPLSNFLVNKKINYISCNNRNLCFALHFYGIKKGNEYKIYYSKRKKRVSIFHKNKLITNVSVSKLNTL
jgi:4-amino-4-deoxy-L-arabinose transferase-like glycosyltransferase